MIRVADSTFYQELAVSEKERYLFLEDHPLISHFWLVESFDPAYQRRLDGVLSRHKHISVFGFERFRLEAEKAGYELIFLDDPTPTFEWIHSLSDLPTVEIDSDFPNTIRGLLPFQVKAFNFAKDLPAAILNLATGCIAGDSMIHVSRAGKGWSLTLEQAYQRFTGSGGKGRSWKPEIPTYSRSLVNGQLRLHRIIDILDQGFKDTMLLTFASGKTLRCTSDHEIARPDGSWTPAQDLRPGERVLGTGDASIADAEVMKRKSLARLPGAKRVAGSYEKRIDEDGYVLRRDPYPLVLGALTTHHPRAHQGWVREHILIIERSLGRFLRPGEVVHHRNGQKDDNHISNLELHADQGSHNKAHPDLHLRLHGSKAGKGGSVFFVPAEETIISIEPVGPCHVYDMVMEDPHRNFLANGIVVHNCGKTIIACALVAEQLDRDGFDRCLWVVKAHNKINTARMIQRFIHQPSIVIDGDRPTRQDQWAQAMAAVTPIIVLNYEAFRVDYEEIDQLVTDKRIMVIWDELPTKLRSRSTKLYRSVAKALYRSHAGGAHYPSAKTRPAELRQVMLSATPIEHSPEDFFNAVRLLDPTVYGSVRSFNNTYIAHRNMWGEPDRWRNLDLMGALASPFTFQVEKTAPDIAIQFPKVAPEEIILRLSQSQKVIYDALISELTGTRHAGKKRVLDRDEILSVIQVLQYVCDMPIAVLDSANRWKRTKGAEGSEVARKLVDLLGETPFIEAENVKLDALADFVDPMRIDGDDRIKRSGKLVCFAPYNQTVLPYLSDSLEIWKIPHVLYHGGLSTKQKQAAQDRFTEDPNCRVFLSSDAGSDSINLECASTVVHYSLPWAWSTLIQRQNRIHRITSKFERVRYITLITADTVEDRKIEILVNKYRFHKAVLRGEIAEQSEFLQAHSELDFILFGGGEDHLV